MPKMNKFFPGIGRIEFHPDAGPEETLVFRHYNAKEVVEGRPMEEWFKFAPSFFSTFRYLGSDEYGERSHLHPWDDGSKTIQNHKRRLQAAFELYQKLNVKFYAVSDRDLCPDFDNFEETCLGQEDMCNFAYDLQRKTNIRPLYFSCDLFTHPRYCNGAATNPDAHVFAYAGAQVKHALEMAKRLGAENFVFYHPRDGYQSLVQRNIFRDISHLGQLYRMALQYRDKIGYRGQFLIQPKPFDPRRFQYECDAMTCMAMLRQFGVERHFKLYIKPGFSRMVGRPYEHDVYVASAFNMLGMVDASDNWPEIHSTSDISPYDVRSATNVMKCVMEQGGLQNGGVTLGFKIRREAIEPRDLFHAYILAMDTYARALKNAAKMLADGWFARSIQERYMSYKTSIGEKLEKDNSTFEECEEFIRKSDPPKPITSGYESFENMFNYYVFPPMPR